jgi:hypothetical protein
MYFLIFPGMAFMVGGSVDLVILAAGHSGSMEMQLELNTGILVCQALWPSMLCCRLGISGYSVTDLGMVRN